MDKNLSILGIIIIVIAIFLGGFVVYSANQKDIKQKSAALLDACLADADTKYSKQWDSECWAKNKAKDCSLSVLISDQLTEYRKGLQLTCYYKYPQK